MTTGFDIRQINLLLLLMSVGQLSCLYLGQYKNTEEWVVHGTSEMLYRHVNLWLK